MHPGRASAPARLAPLVGGGLVAVLAGVVFSGAARAGQLADPGALVRWGLPVSATLTDLAGALTVGALVLAIGVLPRREPGDGARPRPGRASSARRAGAAGRGLGEAYPSSLVLAAGAAGAWTLLSVVHLVLTYASVAGQSPAAETFDRQLGLFVTQIELGQALAAVTAVAAVVTALALLVQTPTGAGWTGALALVALWQQAQTGHAAGTASHTLATSAMALHLVGAAVWIGGLAALAVLHRRLGPDLAPAVARYSTTAGWCLAAVGVSGVVNGVVRVGSVEGLAGRYGGLLAAKVVLFAVLGGLGLVHRRVVIGRLRQDPVRSRLFWRLVAVELAVMGAVSGVAVALAGTAPPVPQTPPADPTAAQIVTGAPLPPEPTGARWFTEWSWEPVLAFAAVAGIVVYLRWARRLRRRGDSWPWTRTVSWVAGMLLFLWATSGGPAVYGQVLFSAHMLDHMMLATVLPLFLVLAAPVTLALRALPARSAALRGDASRGPREWILILVHSRWARFLANPLVAAVNFVGSMIAFYYTDFFRWSLTSHVGHYVMVVHFCVVGYLFVNGLMGIDPGPRRPGYPQRLLLLLATMGFHAFFGVALMSSESLLVADWFGLLGRPWGLSAIADQQRGGAIAWGIGELPTLLVAIVVATQWARDDERTARRRDRRVDRDGDVELDAYNEMLTGLASRDPATGRAAGGRPQADQHAGRPDGG